MSGLVLEWRRDDQGDWQARVTYVEPRGRVVTDWMPAEQLRPVELSRYLHSGGPVPLRDTRVGVSRRRA